MKIEAKTGDRERNLGNRVELFKALADLSRLQVVNALLERPHCVEELVERLKRAPSTISFHLRKLEEAGLVAKTKTQYYLVYELKDELFGRRLRDLIALPAEEDSPERKRLRRTREQVLKAFFKNGTLIKIPKQWRKRMIVLEPFLAKFEPGAVYSELQVDERIKTLFADYCTIRRMLIDEGLLTRDGQKYRRVEMEELPMASRAELKRQYKETPKEAGVFRIVNTVNGKVFLGSARNLHGPLNKHRFILNTGKHPIAALQADWNRLGPEAFTFEIAESIEVKNDPTFDVKAELALLEEIWIEKYQPFFERTYNEKLEIREY